MNRWAQAWPWPAVWVWLGSWLVYTVVWRLGAGVGWALLLAVVLSAAASVRGSTRWRRALMGLGFPLSWMLTHGVGQVPAWVWLALAFVFLIVYPPSTWRDAPLFPTPTHALDGLRSAVPLPPMARILDAGAGAGDGLRALAQAYPDARLTGVERSWPLTWIARVRCRDATVQRGDMWRVDWSPYDLVYLFQRPETMPQAAAKAQAELHPGAWLLSLEFEVPGWSATGVWTCPDGRTLWAYQAPFNGQTATG